ncbi:hypothetical protein JXL83_00325 [candidate division WOR-3 bacterium]|nr:hypothetical protein [candidate division WOR-3 bacterium]
MMDPLEILREATAAAKVFICDNSICREAGDLEGIELGGSDLLRACGSVKGAAASINGDEVFKIIFHGSNVTVAFVKQPLDTICLLWQEQIATLVQLNRVDVAVKNMLEPPVAAEPPKEEKAETPEPPVTPEETATAYKEPEPEKPPEEEKIEPPPPEIVPEKTVPEPSAKKITYDAEAIDMIESVLEKYLDDFSSVIFDNEISDLGLKLKGAESFSKDQIDLLIKKLHDAASLIVGGTTAHEMQEDIMKSIKDAEREA